ncbi:MAG: hypothetical protein ABI620_03885 [Chloroflexota bacterium]
MTGTVLPRLCRALGIAALVAACSSMPAPTPTPFSTAVATTAPLGSPAPASTNFQVARPSPTTDTSGPWLVYQTAESSPRIHLARPDGSEDHVLVIGSHPDWSPDGQWIAYEADSADIWIIRIDGTDARRLFDCEDPCILGDSAAWSPDGREIAFTTADGIGNVAATATIKSVNVETGSVRTLVETVGPDYPFYPRWSPDGRQLVLSIQRFATTKVDDCSPVGTAVAVVDLDAAQPAPRFLTAFPMYADYPDWSPDGTTIVFTTYDLGTREFNCSLDPAQPSDLYTIHADGSDLTQLTHNPTGPALIRPVGASQRGTASGPLAAQPTWSPDGLKIVYVYVDGFAWPGAHPWIMDRDGANRRALGAVFPAAGEHPRLRPL